MDVIKTYTKRVNARRAGVQTGIPSELVEITVHKLPKGVRFGWKRASMPAKPAVTTGAKDKALREERNGVKWPKEGSICRAVWDWLDAHPDATVKELKAVAPDHTWNLNNVTCEFYSWRKFHRPTIRQAIS